MPPSGLTNLSCLAGERCWNHLADLVLSASNSQLQGPENFGSREAGIGPLSTPKGPGRCAISLDVSKKMRWSIAIGCHTVGHQTAWHGSISRSAAEMEYSQKKLKFQRTNMGKTRFFQAWGILGADRFKMIQKGSWISCHRCHPHIPRRDYGKTKYFLAAVWYKVYSFVQKVP